jgi:DUF2970 family protein
VEAVVQKSSFLASVKTVLAGAIGVRRKADHESAPLNPAHLIIAAIIFVLLFIFTLLTVVRIVLS